MLNLLPPLQLGANFRCNCFQVEANVSVNQSDNRRLKELQERLEHASLEEQKLLRLQIEQLKVIDETLRTANEFHSKAFALQARMFEYQQAVLRKERYDVPPDKLVVVVADFSSGDPARGREIADEIAAQIGKLQSLGIEVHVLVGEVQPGLVIRSREMANDVGKHFPPQTSYIVLWGSMSELTTRRFRPSVTCAYKRNEKTGVAVSHTLDLDTQNLPDQSAPNERRIDEYERLAGMVCALVPKCYVAFRTNREETVDLAKFYEHLGAERAEVVAFRTQVEECVTWAKSRPAHVSRITELKERQFFPQRIVNEYDNSVMTLITQKDGQPRIFEDKTKKYVCYMDVLETSNRQFAEFLSAKSNQEEAGAHWYNQEIDDDWNYIVADKDTARFRCRWPSFAEHSVVNVTFHGAQQYCKWAKKELPRAREWQAAAGEDPYPWGKEWKNSACGCRTSQPEHFFPWRPGQHPVDVSPISCFDLGGNVAEWCSDIVDEQEASRAVRGGSWSDEQAFCDVQKPRQQVQSKATRWVGFRGVLRIEVR